MIISYLFSIIDMTKNMTDKKLETTLNAIIINGENTGSFTFRTDEQQPSFSKSSRDLLQINTKNKGASKFH